MSTAPDSPPLCVVDEGSFWAWNSWAKFEAMPDKENTVVVIPVAGLADWGLGHPLDAEETVLMHVLLDACRQTPDNRKPLVVPPLRFVFGADKTCAFPVDQPTALALIAEVANSVAAAGFRRIVLMNSSPWNEEICAASARDLRVQKNLHMFQLHLSAVELDFHPTRSKTRRRVQTLATFLLGSEPEKLTGGPAGASWGEEPVTVLAGPAATLGEASTEGPAILAAASARVAKLLSDIRDRAPLAYKTT